MKKVLGILLLAAAFFVAPKESQAATYDWQAASGVSFRLWIPDGVPVVKGLYYHFNESGTDGRDYAGKFRMQTWAKTMGFGIIGTYWTGNAPGGNTAAARQAMLEFATMSSHPEIANAPVLAEGISYGGSTSVSFAATYPEFTIAYLSGASGGLPTSSNPQFLKTPGLIYRGDKDPDLANALARKAQVIELRRQGAQVSFWIQWGFGHEYGPADDMGLKFLSDVVRLRYPVGASPLNGPVQLLNIPDNCGWLADWDTWEGNIAYVDSYANFTPGPNNGFWLPNKDFAYVYRSHATKTLPITLTKSGGLDMNPGSSTTLTAAVGTLSVSSVDFYDGAQLISNDITAPYSATWTATNLGPHSLVAVATLSDGTKRTGYSVQVMVNGNGSPDVVGVPGSCAGEPPPPPPPPPIDAGVPAPPDASPPPPPPVDASVPAPPDAGVVFPPDAGVCECRCPKKLVPLAKLPPPVENTPKGCGCDLNGTHAGFLTAMLVLVLVGFVLRRRRNK